MKNHFVKEYNTKRLRVSYASITYCGKELDFRFNLEAQTESEITCKNCLSSLKKAELLK